MPEAAFAFLIGYAAVSDINYVTILATVWSFLWMQTATAPGLHWGNGSYNPYRTSRLKPVVDAINSRTLKADPSSELYCWLYMGTKGFLIGLPVGGVVFGVLWAAGYWLGDKLSEKGYVSSDTGDALKELFAGAGAGVSAAGFYLLKHSL